MIKIYCLKIKQTCKENSRLKRKTKHEKLSKKGNEIGHISYQALHITAKAVIRGKFIALKMSLGKETLNKWTKYYT